MAFRKMVKTLLRLFLGCQPTARRWKSTAPGFPHFDCDSLVYLMNWHRFSSLERISVSDTRFLYVPASGNIGM